MKREDVKNKIPGITDEQLNWIMQENGADINREKSAATALQTQLDNANAQLKTAQDGLKAFEGVDVAGLQAKVTQLQNDMKRRPRALPLTTLWTLPSWAGRAAASRRCVLCWIWTPEGSADRSTDIAKALDDAAKANPWAFGEGQAAGYPILKDGGTPNHVPSQPDGVLAAFTKLNPNLKV